MTDTLNDMAANEEELDQQQLAEQLLTQAKERGWSWSARTGC